MEMTLTEHVVRFGIVQLRDRADSYNMADLRDRLYAVISGGTSRLVIDLSEVTFIDSACMAILVGALKRSRQAGGDVKLVWPRTDGAQHMIRLAKFDRVFDIFEDADSALEGFFSPTEVHFTDSVNLRRAGAS